MSGGDKHFAHCIHSFCSLAWACLMFLLHECKSEDENVIEIPDRTQAKCQRNINRQCLTFRSRNKWCVKRIPLLLLTLLTPSTLFIVSKSKIGNIICLLKFSCFRVHCFLFIYKTVNYKCCIVVGLYILIIL